jgi:hypothetical protein
MGLVPTIIGAHSATRHKKITNASASIANLRRRKWRHASVQNPPESGLAATVGGVICNSSMTVTN